MHTKDTLPRLVHHHASSAPDRIALTSIGQGSVTWAELWQSSRQWAGWLKENGVASGDRVITLIPQSLEAAYVWMGCCAIGAVEVSINLNTPATVSALKFNLESGGRTALAISGTRLHLKQRAASACAVASLKPRSTLSQPMQFSWASTI